MSEDSSVSRGRVVGLDLGDRKSWYCVGEAAGEIVERGSVATTHGGLARRFSGVEPMRIALEAGTHSPWVSRLLGGWGHEVVVGNPRKIRLIGHTRRKSDRVDAESLMDLARVAPRLLGSVRHVSAQVQADRAVLRAREALVQARARLINHVRGVVKAQGGRLPACSSRAFEGRAGAAMPAALRTALDGVLEAIAGLSEQIRGYDWQLEKLAQQRYADTARLTQVQGVGTVTALAYVCAVEDPSRFEKSRAVGAYLGLVPAQRQSGSRDPQLRISKQGDPFVRKLLVQCAHYILGPFAQDSDLRRYGLRLAERGGKNAKKRATIAVARKLAVLLHRLWVSGEVYDPLRQARRQEAVA